MPRRVKLIPHVVVKRDEQLHGRVGGERAEPRPPRPTPLGHAPTPLVRVTSVDHGERGDHYVRQRLYLEGDDKDDDDTETKRALYIKQHMCV